MSKVKTAILTGLASALFSITIACGGQPQAYPTPTPKSAYETQIQKHYLKDLTNYKEISVDEWWSYYPQGLIVITDSEIDIKLGGKSLTPERVMVGNRYGSVKEYVTFRDADNEVYFVTINALSGIAEDAYSSKEIRERIRNNESELFSSVLTDVENSTSPVPDVEKIIGSENPYAVGTALQHVLRDVEVINFANGEVSPFLAYNARLNTGRVELEFVGVPEATLSYLLMQGLGVNYTIPFVEKDLGMIVGEKITEGKIYESPAGTKTNVRISFEPDTGDINVSGSVGDSTLTRITRYTFYSVKAGEPLKAEEVPPPLKEYRFDATTTPQEIQEALKVIGENIAKKNAEGRQRQEEESRQQTEGLKRNIQEKSEELQQKLQQQQEKAKQQAEELKRKADELKRQAEEQKKKLEQEAKKSKETICKNLPKFIPKPEACK